MSIYLADRAYLHHRLDEQDDKLDTVVAVVTRRAKWREKRWAVVLAGLGALFTAAASLIAIALTGGM